jgi:hypothetical protein
MSIPSPSTLRARISAARALWLAAALGVGCTGAVTGGVNGAGGAGGSGSDRRDASVRDTRGSTGGTSGSAGTGSGGSAGSGAPTTGGSGGSGAGGSGAGGAGTGGAAGSAGGSGGSAAPSDAAASEARPGTGGSGGGGPVDGGSPSAGPAGPWARGVTLGLVEVTQGVFVKIGEGTTVVAPEMRNAPLIEGRPLFVRAHVSGTLGRRLRGVLDVQYGGAAGKGYEDAKMMAGASNPEMLATTFNFLVPAAEVRPGMAMAVSIYEADAAMGPDPATPPRFPREGTTDLAIKAGRMVLDVVAMPVTGPSGALMDTPARRLKLENDLYDLYPVQKVNIRFRAPLVLTAAMTSSSAGFTALRNARMEDGAKPWEYYHLLIGRPDHTFSFAGVASGAGATANDGNRRVAITAVGMRAVDGNTNTFAHEIGHNHGRAHAPACGAAGPDDDFPYMNGALGTNGFSLSTMTLYSKTRYKELMGYCRPRWISDFTWKMLEVRVRIISAMSAAGATTTMLETRSLQAYAAVGERPEWGVVSGSLVDASVQPSAARRAQLTLASGRTVEAAVSVQLLSDGVTRELAVNLPADHDLALGLITVVF